MGERDEGDGGRVTGEKDRFNEKEEAENYTSLLIENVRNI